MTNSNPRGLPLIVIVLAVVAGVTLLVMLYIGLTAETNTVTATEFCEDNQRELSVQFQQDGPVFTVPPGNPAQCELVINRAAVFHAAAADDDCDTRLAPTPIPGTRASGRKFLEVLNTEAQKTCRDLERSLDPCADDERCTSGTGFRKFLPGQEVAGRLIIFDDGRIMGTLSPDPNEFCHIASAPIRGFVLEGFINPPKNEPSLRLVSCN